MTGSSIPTPVQQFGKEYRFEEVSLQLINPKSLSPTVRASQAEGQDCSTMEHSSGQIEEGGSCEFSLPHGIR